MGLLDKIAGKLAGRGRATPQRPVPAGRRRFARPLATWVDANYGPATCVMLTSLYLNNPGNDFDTYIFTEAGEGGVDQPPFHAAFAALRRRFDRIIQVRAQDGAALKALRMSDRPEMNYLNPSTYGKLLLADLVPAEDFLYLDSDLVVQDDIAPLLELDIGRHLVAGVTDPVSVVDWGQRLGVDNADSYINTGVMVVNAARWRREKVLAQMWRTYARLGRRAGFLDQDVLNVALAGSKLVLADKWNRMQHALMTDHTIDSFDGQAFRGCLHFTFVPKPWSLDAAPSMRALWQRYAQEAPLAP